MKYFFPILAIVISFLVSCKNPDDAIPSNNTNNQLQVVDTSLMFTKWWKNIDTINANYIQTQRIYFNPDHSFLEQKIVDNAGNIDTTNYTGTFQFCCFNATGYYTIHLSYSGGATILLGQIYSISDTKMNLSDNIYIKE